MSKRPVPPPPTQYGAASVQAARNPAARPFRAENVVQPAPPLSPGRAGVPPPPTKFAAAPVQPKLDATAKPVVLNGALQRSAAAAPRPWMRPAPAPPLATRSAAIQASKQGAPKKQKMTPVLTAQEQPAGQDDTGVCGSFRRDRVWTVTNPVQGLIIQHVTRSLNVTKFSKTRRYSRQKQTYVATNTDSKDYDISNVGDAETDFGTIQNILNLTNQLEYWELWTVSAAGTVSDGGTDTFQSGTLASSGTNDTYGRYKIKGEAIFYETTLGAAHFGFVRGSVAVAGGLYSTTNDPSGTIGTEITQHTMTAHNAVSYKIVADWDARLPRRKVTRVTSS